MENLKEYRIRFGCECCIKCKGKVLMQEKSQKSGFYPGYLSFPGGHMEYGEDPFKTIIREIKEETGINLIEKNLNLIADVFHYRKKEKLLWNIYIFEVELYDFPPTCASNEGEVKWITKQELKSNPQIVPPMKYYTEYALNHKDKLCMMSIELKNDKLTKVLSQKYI